ncbi:MFS transporter [Rhizobium halophytocola]|uniref:MFS family permease n=1 Tax=Rhizobium halophytocola TaxID=735519 RepID=A0ABS4DXA1_9HYPH|nr:MFS transporter [Rhizobium halophytocola]MBP1850320.1 MFS family permease [Rhizobium halophytocola]
MDITKVETTEPAPSGGRWLEIFTGTYAPTTTMLCLGVAIFSFNGFLVSTTLPTAIAEIGGARLISWSVSLFLTASIIAGMMAAHAKQRFGARASLTAAGGTFLLGTLIAANAGSMPQLLVGRIGQGLGDGLIAATCYTLIPDIYPKRLMSKVFGTEAAVWAIGAFAGPVLAGLLTEFVSWRAAFYVNVPIILTFLAFVLLILPKSVPGDGAEPHGPIPVLRLGLICLGMLAVMIAGVVEDRILSGLLLALALAGFPLTARLDRRAPNGLLPRSAFGFSSLSGLGFWVVVMMSVAQAASGVFMVYGLQNLWHFGPTIAGSTGALMAICWSLSAVLVANIHHPRLQITLIWVGPLLQTIGIGFITTGFLSGHLALIITGQIFVGCGFGTSWSFISQTMMAASLSSERDKTSALLPTLQSAGFALGGAIAGFTANAAGFVNGASGEAVRQPVVAAFSLASLLAALAVAAAVRATRRDMLADADLDACALSPTAEPR